MLLILMGQDSEYALDMQTERRVTHVLHITFPPFCVRLQREEKHLLIPVKFSWIVSSSSLYFKMRAYFFKLRLGNFFWWSTFSVFS